MLIGMIGGKLLLVIGSMMAVDWVVKSELTTKSVSSSFLSLSLFLLLLLLLPLHPMPMIDYKCTVRSLFVPILSSSSPKIIRILSLSLSPSPLFLLAYRITTCGISTQLLHPLFFQVHPSCRWNEVQFITLYIISAAKRKRNLHHLPYSSLLLWLLSLFFLFSLCQCKCK